MQHAFFRGMGVMALGLMVGAVVSLAQSPPPSSALAQCQSVLRVKQDLVTYSEQLAASLLVRAEKAEQELAMVRQQLEVLQPPPKEKE